MEVFKDLLSTMMRLILRLSQRTTHMLVRMVHVKIKVLLVVLRYPLMLLFHLRILINWRLQFKRDQLPSLLKLMDMLSKDTRAESLTILNVELNLTMLSLLLDMAHRMARTTTSSETLGAMDGVNLVMLTLLLFQDLEFVESNKFLFGQQLTDETIKYSNNKYYNSLKIIFL